MRFIAALLFAAVLGIGAGVPFSAAHAQLDIDIRVDVEPPPLPVYEQPPIPEPGYLWVPGYWAWSDDIGYYWVPGTWVLPPEPALLWTPGYWGWDDGVYVFHPGYWGQNIGFYGGVVYGFGYDGIGYEGGYWRDRRFFYNSTVNNFGGVSITNVYSKTVIVNNVSNVSFNGGAGGTTARPTPAQIAAAREPHVPPTAAQTNHAQLAAKDPSLALNTNHGHPAIAATARPAVFNGPGVIAAKPGKPVAAIPPQGHAGPAIGHRTVTPRSTAPATSPGPKPPGAPAGTKIEEKRMPQGGTASGAKPEQKNVQPHPSAPQVAHPPPPSTPPKAVPPPPPPKTAQPSPPPKAVRPPPPKPAPPPPPPKPAAPSKPKCEPNKPCR
jgi:hypothetical protein